MPRVSLATGVRGVQLPVHLPFQIVSLAYQEHFLLLSARKIALAVSDVLVGRILRRTERQVI